MCSSDLLVKINNKLCSMKINSNKSVEFITGQPRLVTESYIKNAYALLSSSKSEKYPVIISEAMANGIPFISTDVGIVKHLPGGVIVKSISEMSQKISDFDSNGFYKKNLGLKGKKYSVQNQNMLNNYSIFKNACGIMQ